MPLGSTAAENATLDACYGSNHASTWPASFVLRLYDGDPREGGVEVSAGGYSPPTVANTTANFPAASEGRKTSVRFDMGTATEDWPAYNWWGLHRASDGVLWECAQLANRVRPTNGAVVRQDVEITYDPEAL